MLWPGFCSAHALVQTMLSEAFYRDILYWLLFSFFVKLIFCAWLFMWETWVFVLAIYRRGWSSSWSAAMATLCLVNGIWQNYPSLYHDHNSKCGGISLKLRQATLKDARDPGYQETSSNSRANWSIWPDPSNLCVSTLALTYTWSTT